MDYIQFQASNFTLAHRSCFRSIFPVASTRIEMHHSMTWFVAFVHPMHCIYGLVDKNCWNILKELLGILSWIISSAVDGLWPVSQKSFQPMPFIFHQYAGNLFIEHADIQLHIAVISLQWKDLGNITFFKFPVRSNRQFSVLFKTAACSALAFWLVAQRFVENLE